MRRVFPILITVIFLTATVNAQQARFGADMGISIARGTYSPDAGVDTRIMGGFDGGLLAEIKASNRVKIQPEFGFLIDGVELNTGGSERTIKLYYATLAVISKWNLVGKLNFLVGYKNCFLIGAWNDPSGGGPSTQIKGNFKFSDMVVVVGAEYFLTDNLFLSARYNHGIEQIVEDTIGFELKNRFASVRIGYIFGK